MELQQLGLELACLWDAGTTGQSLTPAQHQPPVAIFQLFRYHMWLVEVPLDNAGGLLPVHSVALDCHPITGYICSSCGFSLPLFLSCHLILRLLCYDLLFHYF